MEFSTKRNMDNEIDCDSSDEGSLFSFNRTNEYMLSWYLMMKVMKGRMSFLNQ